MFSRRLEGSKPVTSTGSVRSLSASKEGSGMLCKTRAGLVPLNLSSAMAHYFITTSINDALNDGDSLSLLYRQGSGLWGPYQEPFRLGELLVQVRVLDLLLSQKSSDWPIDFDSFGDDYPYRRLRDLPRASSTLRR